MAFVADENFLYAVSNSNTNQVIFDKFQFFDPIGTINRRATLVNPKFINNPRLVVYEQEFTDFAPFGVTYKRALGINGTPQLNNTPTSLIEPRLIGERTFYRYYLSLYLEALANYQGLLSKGYLSNKVNTEIRYLCQLQTSFVSNAPLPRIPNTILGWNYNGVEEYFNTDFL